MDFHVGDSVVHSTHGLGQIVGLEERVITGQKMLYYIVQIQELTVYVQADSKAASRLRSPTSEREFKKLFVILSGPGESISEDRHERKIMLRKKLEDGKADTTCQVIRDISSYSHKKPLNDDDKNILRRAWNSLRGEWVFSMSVPQAQAELELHRLLRPPTESLAG